MVLYFPTDLKCQVGILDKTQRAESIWVWGDQQEVIQMAGPSGK